MVNQTRSRLAGLLAACFAAAVAAPEVGVVAHRHAGGDLPHVHIHPDDGADEPHDHHAVVVDALEHRHHHEDDHHGGRHHHHHHGRHDRLAHDHHHGDDRGPSLNAAAGGWMLHRHWSQPFHRVTPSAPPTLARPRPVDRVIPAAALEWIAAPAVSHRSRGPPRIGTR